MQTFKGFVYGKDPPKSVNVCADGRWFVMSCRNGKAHASDINKGLIQKIYHQTMLVAQYRRAQRESSRAESSCDVHDTDEDDEDNRSQEVCESGN